MKKKLLVAIVAIFSLNTAQAQMPNGSIGPDFTATDLDGNTINLYADFLDQGIPVIMDVSATWCGPCWGFHQGHALKDIYMGSGMGGSQEIGVIFVEGDGSTGLSELQGSGNTQGDWITGTPYPILDNAGIASSYQIAAYPTIYGICPDRTVYEIGSGNVAALKQALITNCSSVTSFTGSSDNITATEDDGKHCSGYDLNPSVIVHNYGSNAVTSLTAELFELGNTVAIDVTNWTGNIPAGGEASVQLSSLPSVSTAANYKIEVSLPNGNIDIYEAPDTADFNVTIAPSTTEVTATFTLTLDNYGNETTWNITDGAGAMLASGGPYAGSPAGTQYTEEIDLLSDGCYVITINDSYGDGLVSPGRYVLSTPSAYLYNVGGFDGFQVTEPFKVGTGSSTSITNSTINKLNIYPNPTSDILNIEGLYSSVEIFDIFGKLVLSSGYTNSIDVSSLANGIYTLNIINESGIQNMKITISK